jgi:hypothetical protein
MKPLVILSTLAIFAAAAPVAMAEDAAKKSEMCEMMKKNAAPVSNDKAKAELKAQIAEVDKLVTAMNSGVGQEKTEAMAAILTRLAAESKAISQLLTAPEKTAVEKPADETKSEKPAGEAPAPAPAPEGHHH